MQKVIIFGTTQFAEVMTYFIRQEKKYEIVAYILDRQYIKEENMEYMGRPVVAFETVETTYPADEYGMFICIGYNQMNATRDRVFKQAKEKGYQILSYVHPSATVLTDSVGEGTMIMEGVIIGLCVEMGYGNVFWADAHVAHHTKMGNCNFFTISTAVAGNIKIGNNCFFGNNCTIRNGITIGDYALIGAGCYVSKNVEAYSVQVPAKSITLEGKTSLDMNLTL